MKHTLGSILVFIIAVGILGGLARFAYESWGPGAEYKTVLLTTGDVYFAKVADGYGRYVTLRDVFYPQIPQVPEGQQAAEVRLIKFGNEIHGPKDEISINREHIVMIQPLRSDSQVITTITTYYENQ